MREFSFQYERTCAISAEELRAAASRLSEYSQYLHRVRGEGAYDAPESSLLLSQDEALAAHIRSRVKMLAGPQLKHIVHIGIGGSSLGTQAVYDALRDLRHPATPDAADHFPEIIFADAVYDPVLAKICALVERLSVPAEIAIVVVSKSGTTLETAVNFEIVLEALGRRFGSDAAARVSVVTEEGSPLWIFAGERGFSALAIPRAIPGRYSVMSGAGLLSLALAGIDTDELRHGAAGVLADVFDETAAPHPVLLSAALSYVHTSAGRAVQNHFFFDPRLETLGKWQRQLTGESLGKNGTGILPLVSVGSADLHSLLQRYLGGKKDIFTVFIVSQVPESGMRIPDFVGVPGVPSGLSGSIAARVNETLYRATAAAYERAGLPFAEVLLPGVSPRSLGAYMQFRMLETMYAGKLFGVNAFDQPDVEFSKQEAHRLSGGS